jgi:hypothetical protein
MYNTSDVKKKGGQSVSAVVFNTSIFFFGPFFAVPLADSRILIRTPIKALDFGKNTESSMGMMTDFEFIALYI